MARHSLPERPDLDQLRRQAKELRRSALAGDREAIERLRHVDVDPATVTLSSAQLVIAREFGFASWPRLKEAVSPELHTDSREPSVSPALMFEKAVAARALEPEQIVVLDGRVVDVGAAPEGTGRARIVIVTAMGPPPGDRPDPREIVLTCQGGQSFSTARRIDPGEPGPALRSGDHGLALEDIMAVEELDAGRIIVLDGELVTCEPDAPGSVRLLIRIARRHRELVVVCPADMELGTARRGQPRGLMFEKALAAERLEVGQVVVVDGRVLESSPDPGDPSQVRLVLATVLGPPPGDQPDQRELVLSCPRDMELGTAIPHNLDGPPMNAPGPGRRLADNG